MLRLVADSPQVFSKEWWASDGLALGLLVLGAIIINFIARRYSRRLLRKADEHQRDEPDRVKAQRSRRRATVSHLLITTFQVVVWAIVVSIILVTIGVNLGPLIAGAGIIGVALGFGAQTIVRDTLSGFFILVENQFDVGDTVQLETTGGPVIGTVEQLTLRVTSIRSYDGTLNTVPNGNINVTSNKTRGWGRAIVDIRLSFDEDVEKVRTILQELFDEISGEEPFSTGLREEPEVLGVVQLALDAEILRVAAETIPSRKVEIERVLRERITTRLSERGVVLPAASVVPTPPGP
jgi:moderate conductance mechanosensitive channel